jgi:hypothetical protein
MKLTPLEGELVQLLTQHKNNDSFQESGLHAQVPFHKIYDHSLTIFLEEEVA